MSVGVEQEPVLAELLGEKQGFGRPHSLGLAIAQHACQFLANVFADSKEAPDHVPPEQGWKVAALLERLNEQLRGAGRVCCAHCHKRSRDTAGGMKRRHKLLHRSNHFVCSFLNYRGEQSRDAEEVSTRASLEWGIQ